MKECIAINNESFTKTKNMLSDLHVRNNSFFMFKNNPSLRNVNPYDEKNLTNDTILAIVSESSSNIWYFLGEIVSVPSVINGAVTAKPYELNVANVSMVYCMTHGLHTYTVTPEGISTRPTIYAYMLWEVLFFNGPDIVINDSYFSGHCDFSYVQKMVGMLPSYLKNTLIVTDTSIVNSYTQRSMYIAHKSISIVNKEELKTENKNKISFYGNFEILPINVGLLDIDKDLGINIIESEIGDRNSQSGKFAYEFVKHCFKWRPECLDITIPALKGLITDFSMNEHVYIQFDFVTLCRNDDWAKCVIENLRMTEEEASRKIYLNRHKGVVNG